MATVIPVERKTPVLKRPGLPCLKRWHTVNVMAGCPYSCRYCYAKSFQSNPGNGRILFYANTFELLKRELPRKRVKPTVVYFSTACDPFPSYDDVLEVQFDTMKLLLESGAHLLISTKSSVPGRFLNLFTFFPGKVVVQMGLTTTNDAVRSEIEPHAASVRDRLQSIRGLMQCGVHTEARLDPLIPGLTDGDDSMKQLFQQIVECGITTASASYLFLRPAVTGRMNVAVGDWAFRDMAQQIYTHKIRRYCGNNSITVPDASYRKRKYKQLISIAKGFGLKIRLCHCKNPDITKDCCHPSFRTGHQEDLLFIP